MGTDIHLIAEARDDEDKWQLVPGPIIDCVSCDGLGVITAENHSYARADWLAENLGKVCTRCGPDGYMRKLYVYGSETQMETESIDPLCTLDQVPVGKIRDSWYSDRNYDVFAVLANVRNGRGFAGTVTGGGFVPISSNRGFPDDLSEEGREWFMHHGGDHSATWVSLREVLSYDYGETISKTGIVDLKEFKVFAERGRPENWSGDISGGSVRHVSHDQMRELLATRDLDPGDVWHPTIDGILYVTRLSWSQPASTSLQSLIDRAKMLAVTVGERETRLVMDFDS
jgi:hypothetical protein